MKITSFGLSVPAATIGTVTSSLGVRDVAMASNTIPATGYMIVATSSNTMEWQDARAFGSNTADVSSVGTMGASASNTRADHVHRGVRLVSAAGSNSLYGDVNLVAGTGMAITTAAQSITLDATARVSSNSSNAIAGPVNLAAGTNIALGVSGSTVTITSLAAGGAGGGGAALTVEEVDGTPTVSATKLVFPNGTLGVVGTVATYTPATGGGGLTASYLGYNTAGGSSAGWATATTTTYVKKITTSGATTLLSIGAYIAMTALAGTNPAVGVWTDVAGSPGVLIAVSVHGGGGGWGFVGHSPTTPGWMDLPISTQLAAATSYWIGFGLLYQGGSWQIYYDGSGADGIITATDSTWIEDATYRGSFASGTNKYSIRALVLS